MAKVSKNRVNETKVAEAVLEVLAASPNGKAPIASIVKAVPKYLKLSDEDCAPSPTRKNEQMWEQQVRNITSHKGSPGNYIHEGFLSSVKGGLQITDIGLERLKRRKR